MKFFERRITNFILFTVHISLYVTLKKGISAKPALLKACLIAAANMVTA